MIGVPLLLAVVAYIAFIYAGVKKSPSGLLQELALPAGVPLAALPPHHADRVHLDLHHPAGHPDPPTPDEHDRRPPAAGAVLHATQFFLFTRRGVFKLFGVGTFAFGFAFTLFELLIILLQAYIFAMLTAVYIQLALVEEH